MKLQPGDHVAQKDLTEEQYHAIAKKFMEAGAEAGEYTKGSRAWSHEKYFGWGNRGGLFHGGELKGRLLTPSQILEDDVWSGEGLPPVNSFVEYAYRGKDKEGRVYDEWEAGDKLEVLAIRSVEAGQIAICFNLRHETASGIDEKYLRPIKSDRDKAIAACIKAVSNGRAWQMTQEEAGILFDAGLLKLPEGRNL